VGDLPDIAAGPVQQTRARHILIRVDDVVLNDAQARERIAQLRQRIVQGGASFADLARQHSVDASAPQGGDLGWLSPGDTVPSFEQAMDALKPGEVSEPVRSPFGWHIIQVEARRMQDVTEERLRNLARQSIRQRKIQEAYAVWAQQVRDSAYVERRLDREP
jgi:peptidyl-prolyl cis-trans isomerase SurA